MSGTGRKRNSKWDFKEDSHRPIGDARGNDWPEKPGTYFREKESESGRSYPEGHSRNGNRRYVKDGDDQLKSKLETRQQQPREPWLRNRGSRNGDGVIGDYVKNSKPTTEWEGGGGYDTRKASGFDEHRQRNFRQSPKRDWLKSHRSRSKSRSRSRSRSPFYGVRQESGFYDKSKNRSRISPQCGKDFIDGRYWRGNDSREQSMRGGRSSDFCSDFSEDKHRREVQGRYLHEGNFDGVFRRSRHEAIRERESNRRDGDAVLMNNFAGESHRRSDIPCKFFAAGNCRDGKNCRFYHHGVGGGHENPDRKERDDRFRQDHIRNDPEKLWNSAKWSDVEKSDAGKSSEVETAFGKTVVSGPKGNGYGVDDMEMSPDWNYGVQTLNDTIKKEHGHIAPNSQPLSLNDASVPTYEHGRGNEVSWRLDNVTTTRQLLTENGHLQQDSQHGGTNMFSCNGESVIVGSQHLNYAANVIPVQSFNQNDRISGAVSYSNLQSVGDSQLPTATDVSSGLNMNNPVNGAEFLQKSMNKPDIGSSNPSQTNSSNFLAQNMVTTEQLNHITNLSASLAQFFGNGQQLPQLYSASNPQNAVQVPSLTNAEGHVKGDSLVVGQPNQAVAFQAHDPRNDRIEPMQHGNVIKSESVPVSTTSQMNTTDPKPKVPVDNLTSSVIVSTSLEKEPTRVSHLLNESEPVGDSKVSKEQREVMAEEFSKEPDDKKITEENEDLEDAEGDDKADEDKKVKDPKEMRAFKFALVEVVKELLKPAWKDGRISKDAYKNIVKKAVDKVTGTMKSAHIPQTQEKIDHYLSASKPKLTKLVQAYVNKFQKS